MNILDLHFATKLKKRYCSYKMCSFLLGIAFNLILVDSTVQAQGFDAALIAGFNASQLEGDNLSGFNKLGLNTGLRIEYALNDRKGIATELLYNQKGSSSTLKAGTPVNVETLTLQYFSMPVYYYLNEWKHEAYDYYRFQLEGGFMVNRLFGVNSSNSFFNNATQDFNDWDLSLSAGLGYRLGPTWKIALHYERSVTKIYQLPNSDLKGLQSYLINIRASVSL
jgi:hypothetical protein